MHVWNPDEDSSQDIIDILEVHNEEEDLLEKLGIARKPNSKPYEDLDDKEKQEWDERMQQNKENEIEVNKLIKEAKEKLRVASIAADNAVKEVENLRLEKIQRGFDIETEKGRDVIIEKNYLDDVE